MRLLILLWLITLQRICFGQLNDEVFFNYSSENSSFPAGNIIENFSEEENGIIWMSSRNGLYRFDGIQFKNISKSSFDSNQILKSHINCQLISGNYLYAGTYANGLYVLNLKNLKAKQILLFDSSIGNNFQVNFIYDDGTDSLWVGTNKEPILKLHKTNFGKRRFSLSTSTTGDNLATIKIKKIIPGRNGLWALQENAIGQINTTTGLFKNYEIKFSKLNLKNKRSLELTDMHIVSDSVAWITSFNYGLIKWNFIKDETEFFQPNFSSKHQQLIGFNNFSHKTDDEFFISSSGYGLVVFNTKTKTFNKYDNEPGKNLSILPGGSRVLYKDKKDALWISFLNGVAYYHPKYQLLKKINLPADYKNLRLVHLKAIDQKNIFASLESNKGSLIYNTENKNWSKLLPFYNEDGKPENSRVYYTANINKELLFKPALPQFYSLQHNPFKFIRYNKIPNYNLIAANNINGIAITNSKILCTSAEAVLIFNEEINEWQTHKAAKHPDSLHTSSFRTPLKDKYGNVWMQSLMGISIYENQKNSFTEISSRTKKEWYGLQNITDFIINKEGTLAFAATKENGVFVFDTRNRNLIENFNTENLLPQNDIYKIALSNADSILWVAAYQSISRINIKRNTSTMFDEKNSSLQLKMGFISLTATEDGEVFVADSVLYNFKANKLADETYQPFVSSYQINNEWHPGNSIINMPKENSFIELSIATGNYADKNHEIIYYAVNGEKLWNQAENGKIILTSLENGLTTLTIKVVNNGINNAEGFTIVKINRAKYYYQTWWFSLATFLMIMGSILFFFLRKIKLVRQREREKAENEIKISELEMASLRSQMNPHFLFNSLSSLRYLVMTNETKKATKFIVKLSKLLRRILNHSQEQTILLQDELEALELYLEIEALRFENGFTYKIDIADADDLFHIEIPPLLLQPIVENAIKHGLVNSESAQKWVKIKVQQLPNENVEITITDNGIGRKKSASLKKYNAASSMGNSLTAQRILLFNKTHTAKLSYSIKDICNDKSNPGTEVKIIYRSAEFSAT